MSGKSWCLIFLLLVLKSTWAQEYEPQVNEIIDKVNIDSLVSFVRILSGEDSLLLGSIPSLIPHRTNDLEPGNGSTAEYLKQKLNGYGLQIVDQSFGTNGRNIIAMQPGYENPAQIYIICAHYDAVDYYCADDNASGVAAVLEASRILSGYQFKQSIAYSFWDEEEDGLVGSRHYADQALQDSLDIRGVINIDMIGWDENSDGLMEIHTMDIANSPELADLVFTIDELYDLPLTCKVQNPGHPASDHRSFWDSNYGAVLLIEGYFGGDFNPYYHSSEDRVERFNLSYFTHMSKLAIGTISTLALENPESTYANHLFRRGGELKIYPNPVKYFAYIQYELLRKQRLVVTIYNTLGNMVLEPIEVNQSAGKHTLGIQMGDLSDGIYFMVLETPENSISHKLIVLR